MLIFCTTVRPCYSLSRWKARVCWERSPSGGTSHRRSGWGVPVRLCSGKEKQFHLLLNLISNGLNRIQQNETLQFLTKQGQKQPRKNSSKLFPLRKSRNSKIRIIHEYLYFCSKEFLPEKSQGSASITVQHPGTCLFIKTRGNLPALPRANPAAS